MNAVEGLNWGDAEPGVGIERETRPGVEMAGPEVAEVDLLIARPDLGPDSATFIRAGDPIPAVLVGRERTPAGARPSASPPRRRKSSS